MTIRSITPRKVAALVAAVVFFFPVFSAAGSWEAGLDETVLASMRCWQVPGLALVVVQDGRVSYSKGFGVRDIDGKAPVTPETLFAIGSASKAFTATALGMLVDEGKIAWEAPVIDYLPGFRLKDPWVTRNVNLLDMLSHRSGLAGADVLWVWQAGFLSRQQLVESMRFEPQAFPFRSRWHYNNLMILAAGRVIPAVSGLSWDDFIKARIFTPLEMRASNTSVRDLAGLDNVARPHLLIDGKVVGIDYRNIDSIAPAGAINANVTDMARWLTFQLAGGRWQGRTMLHAGTVLTMRSPQISMPIPYPAAAVPGAHFLGYGLCWFLHDYAGVKLVEHGGNIDGMTALVAMIPEKSAGLVMLSNLGTTRIREVLMYAIADRILGRPEKDWNPHFLEIEKNAVAAAEAAIAEKMQSRQKGTSPGLALAAYAGRYHSEQMGDLAVGVDGDRLTLTFQARTVVLSHWHYETFRLPEWNIEAPGVSLLTFALGPDGRAASLQADDLGAFSRVN